MRTPKSTLLVLLMALLSISINSNAQQVGERANNTQSRYDYNYKWTFGLGLGPSWQDSDVRARLGLGYGITLGKRLYGRPNSLFAFDLRGRLLISHTFGQDHFRSFNIASNEALNGTNGLDYYLNDDNNFVFHNHRTDMGDIDLEGVITLNRLRERTGVVVQFFGGIGLGLHRTRLDQLGADGLKYDYANVSINQSNNAIRSDILAFRDDFYETDADDLGSGIGAAFMPALGIGLGYQLTPRFSVGWEHRIAWTSTDLLDGQQWETGTQLSADNDIHHYSGLFLRWTVGEDRGTTAERPIIKITDPLTNPLTVNVSTATVRADILNIFNERNITCLVNGLEYQNFQYNTSTDKFVCPVVLQEGRNQIVIRAENSIGSDEESTVIIYRPVVTVPTGRAPVVTITNPRNDPHRTQNNTIAVRANVTNVTQQRQIQVRVNGYTVDNFYYNSTDGNVRVNVNLEGFQI